MRKVWKWIIVLLPVLIVPAAAFFFYRFDGQVRNILCPLNSHYTGYPDLPDRTRGIVISPFLFTGADGKTVRACIVQASQQEHFGTPRQQALRERMGDADWSGLQAIDYLLICVSWDHGIRSALPPAETYAAAGLKCVLWEPRGRDGMRPYCTGGLEESKDIPHLLNALEAAEGKKGLMFVGVGEGYGAELMLHAAAREPRLRAIATVNMRAPLSRILRRRGFSMLRRELIGWRMKSLTGLEPFDTAAIKSVFRIPDNVPIFLICSGLSSAESSPFDSYSVYTQLRPDQRFLAVVRDKTDAPETDSREITFSQEGDTHETEQTVHAALLRDADDVVPAIVRWFNAQAPILKELPLPGPDPKTGL